MGIMLSVPGVYIPPDKLTNADLEKMVDTTDEWIYTRTGIKERRISYDKGVAEMGTLATKQLMEVTGLNPKEVDYIAFATNRHDNNMEYPAHAAYVAKQIGADKMRKSLARPEQAGTGDVAMYDLGAGCTGQVYAIANAYHAIKAGMKKNALAIGTERLSKHTDYSDRYNCILFGDGASAMHVYEGEGEGILGAWLGGEADLENLSMKEKDGLQFDEKGELQDVHQNYIQMNGKPVMKFAARAMADAALYVCEDAGIDISNVAAIVPHQANTRIIDAAGELLEKHGFPKERIMNYISKYGNTSTTSIGIAYRDAILDGKIKNGDLVIFDGFGAGLTAGSILFRAHIPDEHLEAMRKVA